MIGDWVYFLFILLIGLWPEDMPATPHSTESGERSNAQHRKSDQRVSMLPLGRVRIVFRLSLGARRKSRAHCHRPKIVSRVQRLPVREGLDYDWSVTLCCLQMKSLCAQLPPSR